MVFKDSVSVHWKRVLCKDNVICILQEAEGFGIPCDGLKGICMDFLAIHGVDFFHLGHDYPNYKLNCGRKRKNGNLDDL
jgi:hypothetical protein